MLMGHRDKFLFVGFLTILVVVVVTVFVHFGYFFDYTPSSTNLEGWMNTAIYFNNVFSPILLLLSILLLYLTWQTTKKELQDSKNIFTQQKFSQNLTFLRQRYEEECKGSKYVSRYTYAIHKALNRTNENDLRKFVEHRNLGGEELVNSKIYAQDKFYTVVYDSKFTIHTLLNYKDLKSFYEDYAQLSEDKFNDRLIEKITEVIVQNHINGEREIVRYCYLYTFFNSHEVDIFRYIASELEKDNDLSIQLSINFSYDLTVSILNALGVKTSFSSHLRSDQIN